MPLSGVITSVYITSKKSIIYLSFCLVCSSCLTTVEASSTRRCLKRYMQSLVLAIRARDELNQNSEHATRNFLTTLSYVSLQYMVTEGIFSVMGFLDTEFGEMRSAARIIGEMHYPVRRISWAHACLFLVDSACNAYKAHIRLVENDRAIEHSLQSIMPIASRISGAYTRRRFEECMTMTQDEALRARLQMLHDSIRLR